jgi:hypothetical protein
VTAWRKLLSSYDGFPSSSDSREGITVIANYLRIKDNDSCDGNDSKSPSLSYFDMAMGRARRFRGRMNLTGALVTTFQP